MIYELDLPLKIRKKILKLDKISRQRIFAGLKELSVNPEIGKHLIGINYWSFRIGKNRIIYQIYGSKVHIVTFGHRKNAYERL